MIFDTTIKWLSILCSLSKHLLTVLLSKSAQDTRVDSRAFPLLYFSHSLWSAVMSLFTMVRDFLKINTSSAVKRRPKSVRLYARLIHSSSNDTRETWFETRLSSCGASWMSRRRVPTMMTISFVSATSVVTDATALTTSMTDIAFRLWLTITLYRLAENAREGTKEGCSNAEIIG